MEQQFDSYQGWRRLEKVAIDPVFLWPKFVLRNDVEFIRIQIFLLKLVRECSSSIIGPIIFY
jgi:hypothetical protein